MSRLHLTLWMAGVGVLLLAGLGFGYGASRWWKAGNTSGAQEPGRWETPSLAEGPTERPRAVADDPAPAGKASGKRALLIGVTYYENLDKGMHLEGPENDVL